MRIIFSGRLWFAYGTVVIMAKRLSLVHFPIDHLSLPVVTFLEFILFKFSTFVYYTINCFVSEIHRLNPRKVGQVDFA